MQISAVSINEKKENDIKHTKAHELFSSEFDNHLGNANYMRYIVAMPSKL